MFLYKEFLMMLLIIIPAYSFASEPAGDTSADQIESVYARQVQLEQLVSALANLGIDVKYCLSAKYPETKFEQNIILDTKIQYLENKLEEAHKRIRYNQDIVSR